MSDRSGIPWTQATWNPVVGCTPASPGCEHCYAARMATRLSQNPATPQYKGLAEKGKWTGKVVCLSDTLDKPLHWKKPRMIFVDSMGDLFHPDVPADFIKAVFVTMGQATQHTFQVLTKRPFRMRNLLLLWEQHGLVLRSGYGVRLPNVLLGVTAESQKWAYERVSLLLQTPAQWRFVSCEPMLEAIDLLHVKPWNPVHGPDGVDALEGGSWGHQHVKDLAFSCNGEENSPGYCSHTGAPKIDWVIAGCESGPGARPCNIEWLRSLRDQCVEAHVYFFLKQASICQICGGSGNANAPAHAGCGACHSTGRAAHPVKMPSLDGKVWDQMPEICLVR